VDLDPRPDLEGDHRRWVTALALAWYRNRPLWSLLHGLRCGGARLQLLVDRDGREFFKLDYRPLLEAWDEKELREKWLIPFREPMRDLFREAPAFALWVEQKFPG